MKQVNITDNMVYVTDKTWKFGLEDKFHQFGIIFEIVDMHEATGEKEFKDYPFVVAASIMADKVHPSFNESSDKPTKTSLLCDCIGYMGGVPIDHTLVNGVQGSEEAKGLPENDNSTEFDLVANQFKVSEARIKTFKSDYGAIAAQQGKGTEHRYLQFKTEEACQKFIDYLLKYRVSAMGMMIGFVLDKPINMIDDNGWSVVEKQVNGCK